MFTFGGLTARLIGPRWAPAAALTLAVTLPEQFTSRSTYSETLAQILFLGALSLWIDAQRTDRGSGGRRSVADKLAGQFAVRDARARRDHRAPARHHAAGAA